MHHEVMLSVSGDDGTYWLENNTGMELSGLELKINLITVDDVTDCAITYLAALTPDSVSEIKVEPTFTDFDKAEVKLTMATEFIETGYVGIGRNYEESNAVIEN